MKIKRLIKIVIINFILCLFIIPKSFTKPIPPGTGEGDVPANILILLDSSVSMRNLVSGDDGTYGIDWSVELSDGSIIFAENNRGFSKFLNTGKRDITFARNQINFKGSDSDPDCGTNSKVNKSWAGDVTSGDVVYGLSTQNSGQIIAIDSTGKCVEVIKSGTTGIALPRLLEIRTIDGEEILFAAGRTFSGGHKGRMYVKNLTNGKQKKCSIGNSSHFGTKLKNNNVWSMTVSNDGDYIYLSASKALLGYKLTKDSDNLYCPTDGNWEYFINTNNSRVEQRGGVKNTYTDDIKDIYSIEYSKTENNKIYTTSFNSHLLQRIEVDHTNFTASLDLSIGKNGTGDVFNNKDPGAVAASDVEFNNPGRAASTSVSNNLFASSSRVLVGDRNSFIHKFDENKLTAALKDTAWRARFGGGKVTKFQGAKDAIEAIVTDSSLTSGANFGFGHWNSGTTDWRGAQAWDWTARGGGEKLCHFYNWCWYNEDGWDGDPVHPDGTSNPCLNDWCLNVGVSSKGADKIVEVLPTIGMAWGTDGNSFAEIAYNYFRNLRGDTPVKNDNLPCQLNYVIVISDGHIMNWGQAFSTLNLLRTEEDVTTLLVGYGGSYNTSAKPRFDALARAGSCISPGGPGDDIDPYTFEGLADKTGCERAIGADTPEDLKTEIESKIRQIIAERLSFSSPSITASLEEGGSIYQAQFNYEKRGEWTGSLLRKSINIDSDGNREIDHDTSKTNASGNWDAAVELKEKGSAGRNIWTVIDTVTHTGAGYTGNGKWNNWNTDNATAIQDLFELTGNVVRDYHNSTSTCGVKNTPGVEDGIGDDVKGLINFVRGVDYFDYNGSEGSGACNITEDRDSILADIYHSQLVEVGAPNASTNFKSNNSEAYWRATKGYQNFKSGNQSRSKIVYAGSNGGTLHAFNSDDGSEEWAFVPPFIAAQLPLLINKNYDGAFESDFKAGGSNAIFGVDGSPVIHDAFIYGLRSDGSEYEEMKSWRTLLFIPYGRGGAGFSVLDVTIPKVTAGADGEIGTGPLHMFSMYNDSYNKEVIRIDHKGKIIRLPYQRATIALEESNEGLHAADIYSQAETLDLDLPQVLTDILNTPDDTSDDVLVDAFTNRDLKAACKDDDEYLSTPFLNTSYSDGATTCYTSSEFTFDNINLPDSAIGAGGAVKDGILTVSELISDDWTPMTGVTATYSGTSLTVNFGENKTINQGVDPTAPNKIKIETTCEGQGLSNKEYDYSGLGETWSTPRIFRIPSGSGDSNILNDRYVAVMGGGMGSGTKCVGSGVFIVDLEGGAEIDTNDGEMEHRAGRLVGASEDENFGFLRILDSDKQGYKMGITGEFDHASPITNSVPSSPVVITAHNAPTADWRGALVYINDLEGKITKINLTSKGTLYEQQTLMNLEADNKNKRYSFFEMEAAIGADSGNLWLFGGTGNFNRISETEGEDGKSEMDNIVYGIRDRDFPNFISTATTPLLSGSDTFVLDAATALAQENSPRISKSSDCVNTTGTDYPTCNVTKNKDAWRYHLGTPDINPKSTTGNKFRKTSAAPTIHRGKVYFPVYEPNTEECSLGTSFACTYDDECGSLDSMHIDPSVAKGSCYEVGAGILSRFVVFGGSLFANLAGPSESSETLVEILASEKQFRSFRDSWRENF